MLPVFVDPENSRQINRYLRLNKPDAIICCNDKTAAILKVTLDGLGIDVPGKVLLAGFDDVSVATIMSPQLTSIHQPCVEIGAVAFSRLLRRIEDPGLPPEEILLPAMLVTRQSTQRKTRRS